MRYRLVVAERLCKGMFSMFMKPEYAGRIDA